MSAFLGAICFVLFLTTSCAKPQYLERTNEAILETSKKEVCFSGGSASSLCISLSWDTMPTETEFGRFIFMLKGQDGVLRDPGNEPDGSAGAPQVELPKVVLWMPSMGHGSSPVAVERISKGLYLARDVFFSMKGDWEIRFQLAGNQVVHAITL